MDGPVVPGVTAQIAYFPKNNCSNSVNFFHSGAFIDWKERDIWRET
jgi:hypothetical protein